MALAVSGAPPVRSRCALSLAAVGTIALATAAGFGAASYARVPLCEEHVLFLFVVAGVGASSRSFCHALLLEHFPPLEHF